MRPNRLFEKGLEAAESGDFKTLASKIAALSKASGHEPKVHLLTGLSYLRRGAYRKALVEFGQSPPEGELRRPALLYTGECLLYVGALVEARNCLQALAVESPELPAPHRWLAAIHYDLGSMTEAVAQLEQLILLEPTDFSPHQLLGQIYADAEKFPEAIHHYRRALQLQPPRDRVAELSLALARANVGQRNYHDALATLDSLDADGTVLSLRAECLFNLGRIDDALAVLSRALNDTPQDRRALLLEARIALDRLDPEAALRPLQQALSSDPHDYAARYQLAQTYQRLGRLGEFEQELARMEESRRLSLPLTDLSQEANDLPNDPTTRERLAETCEQLGKLDLAKMWRKAAKALKRPSGSAKTSTEQSDDLPSRVPREP